MLRFSPWTRRLLCLVTLLILAPAATPKFFESSTFAKFTLRPDEIGNAFTQGNKEERILAAIDQIRAGKMQDARATVDALLAEQANYHLALLLSADLYAMRAMPLDNIGGGVDTASAIAPATLPIVQCFLVRGLT